MSVRTRKAAKDAKTLHNARAQYDAAGTGRRMRGWNPPSSGPQRAVEGLTKIRARSQDAARNDWAGASAAQKWQTTLVGVGITPRWEREKHTQVWDDFVPQADADGVLDAYGLQGLGVRSWMVGGEVFLRRRWRDTSSPLALPVQTQLIESDFCPVFDSDAWPGMPRSHKIAQGIERNIYGRRIAYWMYREHPGDAPRQSLPTAGDLIRVPAADISHVFEPKRPGQLRGVSEMAPVLARLRSSGDFEDAVLERQKIANLFTVFFKKPLPTDWQNLKVDSNTGLPVEWTRNAAATMAGLEPGASMEMLPGEEAQFANPPEAGVTFSDYLRTLTLGTAAAGGLPYEILSGDIREVSDRALRVLIQEFRRFARQRQWHIVIPRLCQPMVDWVADAAVVAGRLRASERAVFVRPEWSPHGWDYIHPVQDVQGKKLAIEAGITSRTAVQAETGEDPRKVQAQREADRKDDEARGLLPPEQKPAAAAAPAESLPTAVERLLTGVTMRLDALDAQRAQPPSEVAAVLAGMLTMVQSQQAALAQVMETMAASTAATHALAMALAQRPIEQHTHVSPTPVNVAVPEQAPPVVNVAAAEAPQVVVNNQIDVQPATVEVTLPARESETELVHDDEGNLVRSVTRERTVN